VGLPQAWYMFACGAAVAGHRDEAFQYLREAVDHGYSDVTSMKGDADLESLHGDARFEALLAKVRQGAAAKPQ
jgi:hypothetical protein